MDEERGICPIMNKQCIGGKCQWFGGEDFYCLAVSGLHLETVNEYLFRIGEVLTRIERRI